jgi:hypothetical protein
VHIRVEISLGETDAKQISSTHGRSVTYCDMSAESQNCVGSRDSQCSGTALQTRPLLGNDAINISPRHQ